MLTWDAHHLWPCPQPRSSGANSSSSCGRRARLPLGGDGVDGLASGFQPQLGQPWFSSVGWPIYQPLAFFWWWFGYDAYAPDIFIEGACIAAAAASRPAVVAIAMSVWRAREAKHVTTYGSARWARRARSVEAGLLGPDGVVLGRWRGAAISAMTVRSMCCASRRPGRARASAWSSRRC